MAGECCVSPPPVLFPRWPSIRAQLAVHSLIAPPCHRPRRKPTLQIASMGTQVTNVQHVPHSVEPEGLLWLKAPGIMEPQHTQPAPLPPRPPPHVHPSREIHGLQVDEEAVEIHGLQVDDDAVARPSRPRRGSEGAEGADSGGIQPAARTGTEPDVHITKVTNILARIRTRIFKNDTTMLIRNCSGSRSHAHKQISRHRCMYTA